MTALEVSRLRVEGSHAVGGVSGLYLRIEGGSRTWVLRYVHMRQRRRMGLGSYPGVTLAAARAAIGQRDAGTDPIKSRQDVREAARLAAAQRLEFDKAADAFITEHESTWRNAKHAQQWRNTLTTYASPSRCANERLLSGYLLPLTARRPRCRRARPCSFPGRAGTRRMDGQHVVSSDKPVLSSSNKRKKWALL